MPTGFLLVDKPQGITSHDVVARARRALGTRKIGHAGTLDPLATGLLVLGVDAATRLLTFAVGLDKTYEATIRLGSATDTDDADGTVTSRADPAILTSIDDARIAKEIAALTGTISQVPSAVSAIKVGGKRAYDLARAGESVELAARTVTVSRFVTQTIRRTDDGIDLDVVVDCSSGTYIRALARDLGSALGVGGHLTSLRRTRVGPFSVADAVADLTADPLPLLDVTDVAIALVGRFDVSAEEARDLRHGKKLAGAADRIAAGRAAVDPGDVLVGVVEARGNDVKSTVNLPESPQ